MATNYSEHGSLDGLVLKATDSLKGIKDKPKGQISASLRKDLEGVTPAEFVKVRADRREDLKSLLSVIANNTDHADNRFASQLLLRMEGSLDAIGFAGGVTRDAQRAAEIAADSARSGNKVAALGTDGLVGLPLQRPAPAAAPAPAGPAAVAADIPARITTVDDANRLLGTLETEAENLASSSDPADHTRLVSLEAQIAATKRRLAALQRQESQKAVKDYRESSKDTTTALADAKEFDGFIAQNFTKIEINGGVFSDGQVYYIANGAKTPEVADLLKKDSSPIRDVFLQKMSGVQLKVGNKEYPAITTRDVILGTYKKAENKSSLSNAVAFDARQYDKVKTTLTAVESTSESTAKGLTDKFIALLRKNPEEAKNYLRNAINGKNPNKNPALEALLVDPALNSQFTTLDSTKVQSAIKSILDGKGTAFVMNDTGIAFDGVSMVEGAILRGKIEGKSSREGFYEVKGASPEDFVKGIPDSEGTIKAMITKADGMGPIEFGGKIFEVKGGKVLSLGKPDGSTFSLKDCLGEYSAKEGIRDAIIVALAVKVWGLPHISLSLPHISLSLPSLPHISLPHLSAAATSFLVGIGLGWFVARLVYGDDAQIGSNVQTLNKYQTAYNKLALKRENPSSYLVQGSEYKHMTWDTESIDANKADKSIKLYRPLGKPQNIEGVDILILAVGANGTINKDKTVIKVSSEKPAALSSLSNADTIVNKIEE